MTFHIAATVVAILALPVAAQAQSTSNDKAEATADTAPPPAMTISGSAAIAPDYRFRGSKGQDGTGNIAGGTVVLSLAAAF